jgi:hypothetical protein
MRFHEVDIEKKPCEVLRSRQTGFLTAEEGTLEFLIQLKKATFFSTY